MFLAQKKIILASNSPRRRNFFNELGIEYSLLSELTAKQVCLKEEAELSSNMEFRQNSIGILAKDDQEDRPLDKELPLQYVQRMAIQKICDALQDLDINLQESSAEKILLNPPKIIDVPWHNQVLKYSLNPNYSEKPQADILNSIFISADTIVSFNGEILGKPMDEMKAIEMLSKLTGQSHEVLTSVGLFDFSSKQLYTFTDKARVHFAPWPLEVLQAYVNTKDPMDKAGAYGIQGIGIFLSDYIEGSWDTVAGLPIAKLLKLLFYCHALKV